MNKRVYSLLALITIAGLILRVIFLLAMKNYWPGWDTPTIDALIHHLWAKQVAAGQILDGGPYFRAPFYAWFLGFIYFCFQIDYAPAYIIQHLIGVAAAPLTFFAARRFIGEKPALIAAAAVAVNGVLIYLERLIMGVRRKIFVAMVSSRYRTMDGVFVIRIFVI